MTGPLDLGTLSATIEVDTSSVKPALGTVKRDLTDVKKGMEDATKSGEKLDINKQVTGNVQRTAQEATKLGRELDTAAKSGEKVSIPKGTQREITGAASAAESLSLKLGEAAGKAIKWSASAAAMAGIGTIGTAMVKGFSRLDSIDQATAKLEALGNSGAEVQTIMDNALSSVTGTAFGIGEAAGTAATMVASGVEPGKELESVLKGVADSAAVAGTGMDDMGLIWGKVAAKGKLDGETMAQMLERQLPIYDILGEKLGVASSEIADMVSEGEVSFEQFSEAMSDYVGGGAVRMGQTVSGAMDNFGAALGRGGAAILESGFEVLPDLLSAGTDAVDDLTARVTPLAQEWGAKLEPHLIKFADDLGPNVAAGFGMIGDGLGIVGPLVGNVAKAAQSIPWPVWAGGIAAVTANQKGWTTALSDGNGKLSDFLSAMGKNFTGTMRRAGDSYQRGRSGLDSVAAGHRLAAGAAQRNALQSKDAFESIDYMGQQAGRSFRATTARMGASAKGLATGGMSLLQSSVGGVARAGQGLMTALGGPWGLAIMGATTAIGYLTQEHFNAKKAEEEHAQSQRDLKGTLDETTGSVTAQTEAMMLNRAEESGWLATATELGIAHSDITAAMSGNVDALQRVDAAVQTSTGSAVEAGGWWQEWGSRFEKFGISAGDVAGYLNGSTEATEKFNDAIRGVREEGGFDQMEFQRGLTDLRNELGETGDAAWDMRDGLVGSANDLNEVQLEVAKAQLNDLETQAADTRDVLKALGDTEFDIEGAQVISISTDDLTDETLELLEKTRAEVSEPMNGRVEVSFPDGMDILMMLDEIGIALEQHPDGYIQVNAEDVEAARKELDELGLATMWLPDGSLAIDSNSDEVLARLEELDFAVRDEKSGEVTIDWQAILTSEELMDELRANIESGAFGDVGISDNTDEVDENVNATRGNVEAGAKGHAEITDNTGDVNNNTNNMRDNVSQGAKGAVRISDNAIETRDHVKRTLAPENTNTFSDHVINITRNIRDFFVGENADGNVYNTVQTFADGGVDRAVGRRMDRGTEAPHHAQIAPAGSYRVFAESETGGEAYIPLADSKRDRSERILNTVAQRFGYQLMNSDGEVAAFANGGVVESITGLVNRHFPEMTITSTHRPGHSGYHGINKAVDVSNGTDVTPEMDALAKWFHQNYKNQLAQLIYWGPWNIGAGNPVGDGMGFYGPGTMQQHRNHVHLAADQPLRNPVPVGNAGLSQFDSLTGAIGASTAHVAGSYKDQQQLQRYADEQEEMEADRELHGGSGTLLRDGSFLELMAAIYSKQTGQPMDDDIVSWGQVVGLYSKEAEKSREAATKDADKVAKDLASTEEKITDKKRDLPEAEEDLRIKKLKRDETYNKRDKDGNLTATESQKASADLTVTKAEQKVEELKAEIAALEREQEKLEQEQFSIYDGLLEPTNNVGGTSGNKYADEIIKEGRRRNISNRGIQIALATALVESDMKMYANHADPESLNYPHDAIGSDHDSVGLFQQRANGAWGTTADRMDPAKSAGMFYDKLDDADYNTGDPGAHAQRVQVSAFPGRYNTRMGQAADMLSKYNTNTGIKVTPMADGGILGGLNRQAQIQDGSSAVLWAEAGEEAYIPLSSDKKARSRDIWLETGKRLGIDVLSLMNLLGSGLAGAAEGDLGGFNTGGSLSAERLGINMDAAKYRGRATVDDAVNNAVGAQFYGPVSINDPQQWTRGQLADAQKLLGDAMRGMR